jgi:polar amino acid transport system substrate-binding protein
MRLIFIFLLFFKLIAQNAAAQTLTLTTEDYFPFDIVDTKTGTFSGISTDKVLELMRRAGEKYTVAAYPWARSFQMARNNVDTCVFSTTRTPEREAMFKWIGPIAKMNLVIFARVDDKRNPKTLESLRPYVLGTYRNDAIGEFFALHGFKTDLANRDDDNPKKLMYGRFDFWATEELHGKAILEKQGLSDKIAPLFRFKQDNLYLACNLGLSQFRKNRFDQILKKMEHDGTIAAIEKKYK